MIDVIDPSVH